MSFRFRNWFAGLTTLMPCLAFAADPSADQALMLTPIQADVQYEKPSDAEAKACTIRPETEGKANAWVVYSGDGTLLRRFIDTNGDNKVDRWCYANGGIEVYRDIDADFNGKADQYRWFGTAGLRWGLDPDEDGRIDGWKWISPEEVTTEVVHALRSRDSKRFEALLLSQEESKQLGFAGDRAAEIGQKIEAAKAGFKKAIELAGAKKATEWVDFSAPRPGVVPADGKQLTKDVVVYENVIAMVDTEGKHGEINVGTMVRVGDSWRLIDAPEAQNSGYFFTANANRMGGTDRSSPSVGPEVQQHVKQLEAVDAKLARATTPQQITTLNKDRADVLRRLADSSTGKDRELWLMQLVDSINAAAQSGNYPNGISELASLYQEIKKSTRNDELIAQVKYAHMTAAYSESLRGPKPDFAKLQDKWQKDLATFVGDFPQVPQAADAMWQLAIAEEFAGDQKKASNWYGRIARDFSSTDWAIKARGAMNRINSVGKSVRIAGNTLGGQRFDVSSLRGNVVLVHYWATWSESCAKDIEELRKLQAKFARSRFKIVGVNVDNDAQLAKQYARKNRAAWPHLHESGGLESPLAANMGIFAVPVMILLDQNGAVMNNAITLNELQSVLSKASARRK